MFSKFTQFFNETSEHIGYLPLSPVVVNAEKEKKKKNEDDVQSEAELQTLPNTPRAKESLEDEDSDDDIYFDPENDDTGNENQPLLFENKKDNKNEDSDDEDDEDNDDDYSDPINDDSEEELKEAQLKNKNIIEVQDKNNNDNNVGPEKNDNKEESEFDTEEILQFLKELNIINDEKKDVINNLEEEPYTHEALLQDLRELGVLVDDSENANESIDDQSPQNQTSTLSKAVFMLTVLAAAGVSIPTAMYALILMSGIPIKTAGEDLSAWWNSMSPAKKFMSIVFAGSSEYVNTKLYLEFFNLFWNDLTTNLKNCFTDCQSFFVNTLATFLGLGGAIASGALAYEGLEFSKPLATTFGALNSGVFFISRYIGINRVFNRIINRHDHHLQRSIIDEMDHLKEGYKTKLITKLNQTVLQLLQNKKPDESKELTKADFEIIFKELADELDNIKSNNKNCFNEKTKTERASEIAGNIFDNALAGFVGLITLITFARKTRAGVETISELISGANYFENVSNLFKILIGSPGGSASAMLFGVRAKDIRADFIETGTYLYNHPKERLYFLNDLVWNICATTSMFYVGTTIPGPTNEYNIPQNPGTYWAWGLTEAFGAFGVNFSYIFRKYRERPDNKKPTLDQFIHHFRNANENSVSTSVLNNLSMFKPKKIKVVKPIYQDREQEIVQRKYAHR